jgi:hypothetical protein
MPYKDDLRASHERITALEVANEQLTAALAQERGVEREVSGLDPTTWFQRNWQNLLKVIFILIGISLLVMGLAGYREQLNLVREQYEAAALIICTENPPRGFEDAKLTGIYCREQNSYESSHSPLGTRGQHLCTCGWEPLSGIYTTKDREELSRSFWIYPDKMREVLRRNE